MNDECQNEMLRQLLEDKERLIRQLANEIDMKKARIDALEWAMKLILQAGLDK